MAETLQIWQIFNQSINQSNNHYISFIPFFLIHVKIWNAYSVLLVLGGSSIICHTHDCKYETVFENTIYSQIFQNYDAFLSLEMVLNSADANLPLLHVNKFRNSTHSTLYNWMYYTSLIYIFLNKCRNLIKREWKLKFTYN